MLTAIKRLIQNTKEFLKNLTSNRGALILLAGIAILIFLVVDTGQVRLPNVQTPVTRPENPSAQPSTGTLKFITAIPPSGLRSTLDNYATIVFEFSEPVDPESVRFSTDPYIELKVLYNEKYANRVSLTPADTGWEPSTSYTLTISDIKSKSGSNSLAEPVIYTYFNEPPDTSEMIPPY